MKNPIVLWYEKALLDYDNIDSFPDYTQKGVYYNYLFAKGAYDYLCKGINDRLEYLNQMEEF